MKNMFYGVATAIYGNNPSHLSATVLGGKEKSDIRILSKTRLKFGGESGMRIAEAMNIVMSQVRGVCELRKRDDTEYGMPIVFGAQKRMDATNFSTELFTSFPEELGEVKELVESEQARRNGRLKHLFATKGPDAEKEFWFDDLNYAYRACLSSQTKGVQVKMHPRTFQKLSFTTDGKSHEDYIPTDVEKKEAAKRAISAETRANFFDAFTAFQNGDKCAEEELHKAVRKIAIEFASLRKMEGPYINRFMASDSYPHLQRDGEILNFVFLREDLRDIFTETFLKCVGAKHNMCIKSPRDKKNPPFSDVCATYIADLIDLRDGTEPGAAMARD